MALLLVWLPLEDVGTDATIWIAAAGLVWVLARWLAHSEAGLFVWSLRGGGLGLFLPLAVTVLAAFKAGVHAHGFADLSPGQLAAVWADWYWWTGSGVLSGWSGWLAQTSFSLKDGKGNPADV